jgi:hypothetical protein
MSNQEAACETAEFFALRAFFSMHLQARVTGASAPPFPAHDTHIVTTSAPFRSTIFAPNLPRLKDTINLHFLLIIGKPSGRSPICGLQV